MSHTHKCPCGSTLTCQHDADHCAIKATEFYQCPTCELASFDAWVDFLSYTTIPLTTTHHKETRES